MYVRTKGRRLHLVLSLQSYYMRSSGQRRQISMMRQCVHTSLRFDRRAGKYLELFGRKNNLRNHWVTVGNEVTGTGLPVEDQQALDATKCIPGAVYGARHRTKL